MSPAVYSPKELQQLSRDYDLRPRRSRGQNFVIDASVISKMLAAAQLDKKSTVLEIGPGFGVLTAALLEHAGRVVAIELEKKLISHLHKRFAGNPRFTLVQDDFRDVDLGSLGLTERDYEVVANLPYQITSYVIRRLCSLSPRPRSITLLVQKEVGERIIAPPGQSSLLSIAVAFYAKARLTHTVSSASFWPQPKVSSAIVHLDILSGLPRVDEKAFFNIVRSAFQGKRKKLRNTLAKSVQCTPAQIEEILKKNGINPDERPQSLNLTQWLTISKALL